MKVLLVEDEKIIALYYKKILDSMGIQVVVAHSGEDALALLDAQSVPDLLLMDINLEGGMDGIEACSRIKMRFDVPVVYVTAYSDPDTRARAEKTGPSAYLVKPVDANTLRDTVRSFPGSNNNH